MPVEVGSGDVRFFRMRLRAVLSLSVFGLALAACKKDSPAKPYTVMTSVDAWIAPPPASAASAIAAGVDAGPPDPYAELPAIDAGSPMLADRKAGYSKDDKYLGFEISVCDPCPSEFHFTGPGVPAVDVHYHYDPANDGNLAHDAAEKRAKANDDAVDRKLQELGIDAAKDGRVLRGPFPYPDIVFATTAAQGAQSSQKGTVALLFGGHVASEPKSTASYPMRIEVGAHPMYDAMPATERARIAKLPPAERDKAMSDWHAQFGMSPPVLAYVNVTKDGREIGVVAVASGSMWFEAGAVGRMNASAFAAKIYDDTGMRRQKAQDFTGAAIWFEKAESAKPDESLYSYDLACAWAKAKDPRAKDALDRAITRAGSGAAAMKARAQKDADFDAVRADPWFASLVH
ncbi:hypothetical protein BH09MYX1_BH09MYX1_14880 [soil metagenome]